MIFRFYAELNDFLPKSCQQVDFPCSFTSPVSVKHMAEALGVAHTEIDLILVNGLPVDFSYLLQDGDRISVFPVFESLDITSITRVRPEPLREIRFALDVHLGKLAAYLRLLGFDALYGRHYTDEELARISHVEKRVVLTRDCGLLKRKLIDHGYCIRSAHPHEQVEEVLRRFDLKDTVQPFTRCLNCNGSLFPVEKQVVLEALQPETQRYYDEFFRCATCKQIYWKGSHYFRMQKMIDSFLNS